MLATYAEEAHVNKKTVNNYQLCLNEMSTQVDERMTSVKSILMGLVMKDSTISVKLNSRSSNFERMAQFCVWILILAAFFCNR